MAFVRNALVHTTAAAAFAPPAAATMRANPPPADACMRMMASTSPVEVAVPEAWTLRGTRYSPNDANSDGGRWLFLHGWLDNSDSFAALAPKLCDADGAAFADVVALDLAGHAPLDHRNGPYHAVISLPTPSTRQTNSGARGLQFNVAGHSLGGGVALMVAGAWRTAYNAWQRWSQRERSPSRPPM